MKINLTIPDGENLKKYANVIDEVIAEYNVKRGKKERYSIYANEEQISIYGSDDKANNFMCFTLSK